jgi:hypothetical protein
MSISSANGRRVRQAKGWMDFIRLLAKPLRVRKSLRVDSLGSPSKPFKLTRLGNSSPNCVKRKKWKYFF